MSDGQASSTYSARPPGYFTRRTWRLLLWGALLMGSIAAVVTGWLIALPEDPSTEIFVCGVVDEPKQIRDTIGYRVFQTNCAACHNRFKDATGPALQPALSLRGHHFLRKFLTSARKWPNDSISRYYKATFLTTCVKIPSPSREEIDHLERYIKLPD